MNSSVRGHGIWLLRSSGKEAAFLVQSMNLVLEILHILHILGQKSFLKFLLF